MAEYDPNPIPSNPQPADLSELIRHLENEHSKLKYAINELYQPEAWHEIGATGEPAFQNSWANEGTATNETAAFRKTPQNILSLKGYIDSGTTSDGTVLFTLPAAYRPRKTVRRAGMFISGGTENSFQIIITTNGNVAVYGVTGATPALSLHTMIELDN